MKIFNTNKYDNIVVNKHIIMSVHFRRGTWALE